MAEGHGGLAMLICTRAILDLTLGHILAGGADGCETAVLWLGRRSSGREIVAEAFRPQQVVDSDFFQIPAEGMRRLLVHIRERRMHILAQVHSHPELAFHSRADNEWAVVRHQGAVSLVVPWFGARTSPDRFLDDVAAFQLDASDQWLEVEPRSVLEIES